MISIEISSHRIRLRNELIFITVKLIVTIILGQ